jgi:hypothetical protein
MEPSDEQPPNVRIGPLYRVMVCRKHGRVPTRLVWSPCRGAPPHLTAVCSICGSYIKHEPQTHVSLKYAPIRRRE